MKTRSCGMRRRRLLNPLIRPPWKNDIRVPSGPARPAGGRSAVRRNKHWTERKRGARATPGTGPRRHRRHFPRGRGRPGGIQAAGRKGEKRIDRAGVDDLPSAPLIALGRLRQPDPQPAQPR